jgi:hypothetical protein
MNNKELEQLLKSARVPEPPADYWEGFPARVMRKTRDSALPEKRMGERGRESLLGTASRAWASLLHWKPAWGIGLAAICIALALGFRHAMHSSNGDAQLAGVSKYYREIAPLFPNQLEAIVLDDAGANMILADQPNVPASPPVYVKICGPKGCERFVTFSGQRIRVNGDVFEVLVDRQGDVLVVGPRWVWSSSEKTAQAGSYRIEARPLPANGSTG